MTNPMPEQSQVISHREASVIAREIPSLIRAGDELSAWERLSWLHPADMGAIVAGLPKASRDSLVRVMDPETVAWMLRQMNPVAAARVATRLGSQALSGMLGQIHPRSALDTLLRLSHHQAQEVAGTLEQPIPDAEILGYQPGTAGALMVPQFPSVNVNRTVADARESLRALEENSDLFNRIYLVDDTGQLAGQVSLVDLALFAEDTPVRDIAVPAPAIVGVDTPATECARLRRHYNVLQLPVVSEGRLTGAIPLEFLLGAVVEEDTRQMLNVGAVSGRADRGPVVEAVRTRLPWLTVNLATTFLAAATISLFESTLARVVILAAFLPVVAGQGGIGGTQTLTMIVRSMALGELVGVGPFRLLAREAFLGLLHGVWLGILVSIIALVWTQNSGLALVLGLAMVGNMVIAGVAGAGVPLFLRAVGVDPAVASAVIVTTFTDVFGFLLFLGIASVAISLIV